MSKAIKNFTDALQRLIDGKPNVIKSKYSINNDTVALEAGRKRGAIKKSRPELATLIISIAEAEAIRTGQIIVSNTANIVDIKLQNALEEIGKLEKDLAEIKEKYEQQQVQLAQQIYRNSELNSKLKITKKRESSLLDFTNN